MPVRTVPRSEEREGGEQALAVDTESETPQSGSTLGGEKGRKKMGGSGERSKEIMREREKKTGTKNC